jgi:hypothetical protein
MSLSGLESGLKQGILQGRKTGLGMASSRSGLSLGRTNGVANKIKMQDPVLLASARNDCPFFYWNADNLTVVGGNVTAITNLLGTYNPLTQSAISSMSVLSDPAYNSAAVFNNRAAVTFDSTDGFSTNNLAVPDMTNTSEMTMIMVCKPVSTSRSVLFWKKDVVSDPSIATVGDLSVEFDGSNINVVFDGNPTTETATYRAVDSTIKNNWIILTVKARLSRPDGPGSFLDIFVNGKRCKSVVTDTITSLPRVATSTWANSYIQFGNSNQTTGGNNQIAAGFITEQWMNESEQLRLENYFRWYYGYNF